MTVDERNNQKFRDHLDASNDAVWVVAKMLQEKGHDVRVPPISKAPSHAEWKKHADNGDLFISQRIEVKCLSVAFTNRDDWPFGSKFIVCAKHSFDRSKPKPHAYVILSCDKEYAATVFSSDSPSWTSETRQDKRYESYSQSFYFSPLDKVHFFKLPKQ